VRRRAGHWGFGIRTQGAKDICGGGYAGVVGGGRGRAGALLATLS